VKKLLLADIYIFQNATPNSWLDTAQKIATITIAVVNVILTIYIFRKKTFSDKKDKIEKSNIEWYRELVIKPNLQYFSTFIDKVFNIVQPLRIENLTIDVKEQIQEQLQTEFTQIRIKFLDAQRIASKKLYLEIQSKVDDLQSTLSKAIFDKEEGYPQETDFDEKISQPIFYTRSDVLKSIMQYRGEEDSDSN
jgi:hypothetical protein